MKDRIAVVLHLTEEQVQQLDRLALLEPTFFGETRSEVMVTLMHEGITAVQKKMGRAAVALGDDKPPGAA